MKKAFKIGGLLLAVMVIAGGVFMAYVALRGIPSYPVPRLELRVQATQDSVARGRKLARLLCVSCHLDPATGALTGKHMPDVPAKFGVVYSPNITQDKTYGIGSWTDGELAYLLRTGIRRDGRYEPPYMIKLPHASDDDMAAILAFLRSADPMVKASAVPSRSPEPSFLTKLLCYFAFKPLPYPKQPVPSPDKANRLSQGQYLANGVLDCYGCHSAAFQTNNPLQPELSAGFYGGGNTFPGANGTNIQATNITPDPGTGIGSWTEAQFVTALRKGFRTDRSPLRYPMPIYVDLDEEEARAIFAYLRTVPPLVKSYPRPQAATAAAGSAGKQLYQKYGCDGCHGESGRDPVDLGGAAQKYPADAQLTAFLKRPTDFVPTAQMPAFEGVIAEDEYAPLVEHVRSLQSKQ
ncbi:MAG TPA: c-type cytochrome [Candidatus Angelobacter sp.]